MDLEMRHLRAVVAVADHGGYSAAGQRLHLAQSSLSRTVQEVERRLGVALFERTTRAVRPTVDGERFVALARDVLSHADAALRHFEGYLAGTRGTVSVAALPSLAATLLPPVVSALRERLPEVTVRIRDGLSAEVLDHLRSGRADLAVTVADTVPPGPHTRPVAADRFHCVCAVDHPFADRADVSWADLSGEPFVAFDATSSIRAYVDRTLTRQRVELGPVTEARNVGAVAGLAAAGLGVSAVPALVLPLMSFADLHHRPLTGPAVERDIRLVHDPARPLSATALAMRDLLETASTHALRLPHGARWVTRHARDTTDEPLR
ncbi:LysR family transcriptional regulator [Saccharomonospora saliphila]|uniref:LysR family transcriptional regulator n=1 Tax=Saccharomonospora saliphila TaxID=369829 RepID=UPI0018DC11FE|nr:LysR family transcriptional regulator [Saccharomonospora saliphila]